MARAPTTLDPFNAIAEPKRRQLLETLASGELPVNDIIGRLAWPQPMVSKHLGVLKAVGLVSMRREGRQRLYKLDADRLKPIHDWVAIFQKLWDHQLSRVKERAERKAKELRKGESQ
jgi:DNA-binding transcriptional ArsR family regulator